ncbi:hypothetical protein RND81_10G173600 [Saponaria officinalis]|uniref:Uncharacterized protein n=1 Tax=Saponaria officinalis TaxID=3572 RepID=A0AAW1I2U6_SAPOF
MFLVSTKMVNVLLIFTVFSLLNVATFAAKQSYIVYMGAHSHGPYATLEDFEQVEFTHQNFLASYLGSHENAKDAIFYSYKTHINGFAAILDENQAAEIAKHPEVISVFPNKGNKLHTTHSWEFMNLEKHGKTPSHSAWKKGLYGKNTIIANLDTGVWPESKSFNDEGYGPIPSKWKGFCDIEGVPCNRKLIGARFFNKGLAAYVGKSDPSLDNARDFKGHGTHTLSTAGGDFVPGARILNMTAGVAKGGSPKARVAAYKVCWKPVNGSECFDADLLAAFDMAIHDGVDVLSVSVGGSADDYFNDGIAIGAFHAVQNGIVVVLSAGNSGPDPGTVSNVAPWMITVGASTMDREFQSFAVLGNGKRFKGASLSPALPDKKLYRLMTGAQAKAANASAADALLCQPNTLDHSKAKGKIVACLRGVNGRVNKGVQVSLAGGAGMILCNDKSTGNVISTDPHILPATHLTYTDGVSVFAYINSTAEAYGTITNPAAVLNTKPAPYVAAFSSRGPNTITPEILKPDITAPGVKVIAAYSEGVSPTVESTDKRRFPFMVDSGTSMSCPHVSGIAGLLKTRYPKWSPAAIRSAIMTTARVKDNTGGLMKDATFEKATPFSYGAGHVQPNRALNPGLVYDLNTTDYLDFLCNLGYSKALIKSFHGKSPYKCPKQNSKANILNLNYPSITVPRLAKPITITRKVKNVGSPGKYVASVGSIKGVSVTVVPSELEFKKIGEEKEFKVQIVPKKGASLKGVYVFGHLTWTDGKHHVRSPIVISGGI